MAYSSVADIIRVLGGTKRVDFSLSGTSAGIGTSDIGTFISYVDAEIDWKLAHLYGTRGFGTSSNGTRGLPTLITRISAYLTASDVVDTLYVSVEPDQYTWGERLREKANKLLDELASGNKIIAGFVETDFGIPRSNQLFRDVYDDAIKLSGTTLTELSFAKVVKFSERVTGTAIDGTTVYARGVDYNVYYYGDRDSGTMFGNIRRLSAGAIADGQDVSVDYKIYNDHIFKDDDDRKMWGLRRTSKFSKNLDNWGFQ